MSTSIHLRYPLDESGRIKLVQTVFSIDVSAGGAVDEDFAGFFQFYDAETAKLALKYGPKREIWTFPITTHEELRTAIEEVQRLDLKSTRPVAREGIRKVLPLQHISDRRIDALVDAALRVWLMVNFRDLADAGTGGNRPCVEWHGTSSLEDILNDLFLPHEGRLRPRFTVAYTVEICGLEVGWTSSIEDHLRYDSQHKTLWVFLHRRILCLKRRVDRSKRYVTIICSPEMLEGLYDEASRTLDLLFPSTDQVSRRFLAKHNKNFHNFHARPRSLNLRDYPYWKSRILEVYEEVFSAEPEGWGQLWRDRRDLQKFCTFWVALAIFILTTVSTAASITQTWATLESA